MTAAQSDTGERSARLSVMLPRDMPAGEVLPFVRRAEELGFASLWVAEDLGFRGAFAQAGAALAVTERLQVGIGIMPAGARVLEFAAMEAATLAQLFPHRLTLGVGHGMPGWMRSVGAWPRSPLASLERYVLGLQALLAGGRTVDGKVLAPAAVPSVAPHVLVGARGPRSLALAGRIAAGTIMAEPVSPEYVRDVKTHLGLGDRVDHRLVAYHVACLRDDPREAARVVRPALSVLSGPDWSPHIDCLPFARELRALRDAVTSEAEFADALPLDWVSQLALVGPADEVRPRMQALTRMGVTEHVLLPVGPDPMVELEVTETLLHI